MQVLPSRGRYIEHAVQVLRKPEDCDDDINMKTLNCKRLLQTSAVVLFGTNPSDLAGKYTVANPHGQKIFSECDHSQLSGYGGAMVATAARVEQNI